MKKIKQQFVNIWNNVHDWWMSFESRHLWIARLIVYSTCLAVVVLVCINLFRYFNLFHTEVTSARYMLSAVVQTQSAIVAIVITLTLIAVQLTASAYSPRVIDIFKRIPDMWLLLSCYAVSIFYGFIILKLVEGTEGEVVSQSAIWSLGSVSISFEFCVSLAYWLAVFTFVVLFLYIWNIIGLLKPENIIKRLAVEITKDKILNPKEDPIQPIEDIIHGSRMNDLTTIRVGLETVTDQVIEIIGKDDDEKISEYFCAHLKRVSRLTISREDDESTAEVIKNFKNFWETTADKGLEKVASKAVESLVIVGRTAAEKGLEGATMIATWSLRAVGEAAADKGLEDATRQAVKFLGDVGKTSADKGLEDATRDAAKSLGAVGEAAAGNGLEDATRDAARSLGDVGKTSADKGLEYAIRDVARSLGDVGGAAAGNGLEGATRDAARSLGAVGEAAAGKGLEYATRQAVMFLGDVGGAAAGNGLEGAIEETAMALSAIGKTAAEQKLENVITQVALSLSSVGTTAVERKVPEKTTERVAMSLAVLTTSEKKIIENAIQEYKSSKPDSTSAQKFLSQYYLQLEKLKRGY